MAPHERYSPDQVGDAPDLHAGVSSSVSKNSGRCATGAVRSRLLPDSPPNPWDAGPASRTAGERARRVAALVVLVGGILILLAALTYGLVTRNVPPGSTGAAGPAGSTALESQPPGDRTETGAREPGRDDGVPVPSLPTDPDSFAAPAAATQCTENINWRIYAGSGVTSCPFAESVAVAMADNAGSASSHTVRVESPVTGRSYDMACRAEGGGSFTCRGGNGASVVLERRGED